MGYRLEISEIKYKACGGKLYGYSDEKQLKSYKYLVGKGYLDGDKYFSYGYNPSIPLRADEFKEFIKLYNEGLIYRGEKIINWDPEAKTALSNEEVIYKETKGAFYHIYNK